jgi:hypothetical protein
MRQEPASRRESGGGEHGGIMAHPSIGFNTPEGNAWIAFKWVLIWLFACGLPLALSMAAPRWVKVQPTPGDPDPDHHHH